MYLKPLTLGPSQGTTCELLACAFLQPALPSSNQCRPSSEGLRGAAAHLYIVKLRPGRFVAAGPTAARHEDLAEVLLAGCCAI